MITNRGLITSGVVFIAALITLDRLAPARPVWVDIIVAVVVYIMFLSIVIHDVTKARNRRNRKDQ